MATTKQSKSSDNNKQAVSKPNPTPFINSGNASEAFTESNTWMRKYFDPINEFERIARNKPSDKIPDELPKITDGTMAAIVQEQPKRIIQQVPTGMVTCKDWPEYAKIADLMLFNELIPSYNRMGDMLQKSWNMVGKAMTWGRSCSYTFYTETNGKLHTDFVIPYAKDIVSEKGKVFAPDSNISFMIAWLQSRDIKAILNREAAWERDIKGYKSDWNLKALQAFLDAGASAKPADQQTPAEREKGGDSGGFKIVHAFQEGIGAEFYSFGPMFKSGTPLRTKVNKDPRGKMPLDFLYCNIDLSNPMGRGQVELSGGVQNLIDQQMQMFQFITTLMMGPPLQVWGDVDKSSLQFVPNAVWEMGTNPNSSMVKPYDVNNNAIQNFSNNYGLLKSQIFNLNSTQDNSISADAGNPAQSKTQAGVQASQQRLGVSDNYLRKQYESWFEAQSETSINIFFSEMTGKKTMKLEGDDLVELMKTPAKKFLKGNVLTIPYKEIRDVSFDFEVDPSTSEVKEDQDNAEKLTEVLKLMQQSQDPNILGKVPQVIKLIVDEIGAEGTDDLFPELNQKDQNGVPVQQQPQQQPMTPQMVQQMVMQTVQQAMQAQKQQPKSLAESLQIKMADLTDFERGQILQQLGIQPDPSQPSPNAQALDQKQQDLNLKTQTQAQNADTNATKTAMDIAKTAHDHTLALHNAAQTASQPQQPANGDPAAQSAGQVTGSPAEEGPEAQAGKNPALDDALSPNETQVVQQLLHRGFSETDAEQAIVLMRQGAKPEQVVQILGAKYANH